MKWLLYIIRMLLGALFIWSGVATLRHPFEFLSAVYAYQLVGPDLGLLIAAVLPSLEVLLGGCLLAGLMTEGSLLTAAGLCSVFAIAITVDWHRGLAISCGCFGGAEETIGGFTVARSWGLLLVALVGLKLAMRSRPPAIASPVPRRRENSGWGGFASPAAAPDPVYSQMSRT